MNKLKNFAQKLWNDESGQGMAEYILLTAVVVGALFLIGPKIKDAMKAKWDGIATEMESVGK